MAQDFAKHRTPTGMRRKPTNATTKVTPKKTGAHWSWYFSGLMSGVILAIASYLGVVKLETDALENAQTAQVSESTPEVPAVDFGFYTNLATAEVPVNVQPVAVAATATEEQGSVEGTPVNFLLQAGSFQGRQDAENRRAKIILLNMSASIVPGVVSGRTWFRVQVGPFPGRESAEEGRNLLSENNIDSIPMLMR